MLFLESPFAWDLSNEKLGFKSIVYTTRKELAKDVVQKNVNKNCIVHCYCQDNIC